jgi:hypothetical protein
MTTFFRDFKTIVIQGSPAYEKGVLEQLNKLWDTWTGWAVLRGIIDTTKTVTIVPYSEADRKKMGSGNAYARAKNSWAASPLPGFGPKGSDSEVHFSPADFHASRPPVCYYRKTPAGPCLAGVSYAQNTGPDDALVHELVHSLREMRGQLNLVPTRTTGYENQEEYFAILLQNIYGSEKGLTIFRGNHLTNARLSKSLSTSETFLGKGQRPLSTEQLENRQLVPRLTNECLTLCRNVLAHVRAAFNPISEYLRNSSEYPYDTRLLFPPIGG